MDKRCFIAAAGCTLLGAALPQARAQELARKPVTLVVGFAAGGAADAAARLIARRLQDTLGQTVVVDNRAGRSEEHTSELQSL